MARKKKAAPVVVALPDKPEVVAQPVTEGEHADAMDFLRVHCLKMAYRIHWFPRSRQASSATKSAMASAVGGEMAGFSISRRLFSSRHPAIKELNRRRKAIDDWRNALTLVTASDPVRRLKADGTLAGPDGAEDAAEAGEDVAEDGDDNETVAAQAAGRVASGLRLIRKADVKAFWDGFWLRVQDMMEQAAEVESKMDEIKEADRKQHGESFNADDYPESLAAAISVEGPFFSAWSVAVDLPPEVFKSQMEDMNRQLSESVSVAAASIANNVLRVFGDLADQLVNRQRVHPTKASGLAKFENAELLKVRPAAEKDGVKMVCAQLRVDEDVLDANNDFVRQKRTEHEVELPADAWKALLRPTAVTERRKLSTSSVEKLMTWVENFDKVKAMLGSYGEQFAGHMDPVRTLLSRLTELSDGSPAGLADALREGDLYRKDLANTLTKAVAGIEAVGEEVKAVRRRLNKDYVGQV